MMSCSILRPTAAKSRFDMPANTRARSAALQDAARALIVARGMDATTDTVPRVWAAEFAAQQGCTIETARRHLAKAARRMRGEVSAVWGGTRPGAGRPRKVE